MARTLQKGAAALFFCLATAGAQAAEGITADCKKSATDTALDFSSLNLYLSAAVPPGTVLYSGNMNITFLCALNNPLQGDNQAGIYFKRKHIDDSALGYGLTLYTGYGGALGRDAEDIASGKMISACADGGDRFCNRVTLTVPFQIVKTSASITAPAANNINIFDVGTEIAGTDLKFYATNISSGITLMDETCSPAGTKNMSVALGNYSMSSKGGLGSGIGSTSAAINFALTLNCEALLSGAFDVMMQFNGTPVSGLADKGVLALTAVSNAATNVGIQLLDKDKKAIALGIPFRVASFPLSSALIKIPFYARYYQTGEKITAGVANSLVTYTISYQ